MKRLFFIIIIILGFKNFSFCQLDHFYIGIYDYDYDGYYEVYPPGTDPDIGNDTAYLHKLADQNFSHILIVNQLLETANKRPYPNPPLPKTPAKPVSSYPSKAFLDNAHSFGLKVVLHTPEITINNRAIPNASTYNSVNSLASLNYYGYHPAIAGFSIVDEPSEIHFPYIDSFNTDILNFNSSFISVANLFPLDARDEFLTGEYLTNPNAPWTSNSLNYPDVYYAPHVQKFIDETHPNVLSCDIYPIFGNTRTFYYNLDILGKKSSDNNIPFIFVTTTMARSAQLYIGSTIPIISIPEHNYLIYSAMAYGAKGINYWNPDWMYHSWIGAVPLATKNYLKVLHKKLIDNGDPLLNLSFRSAYHYSFNTTVTTNYTTERIPDRSLWVNLKNDEYAKQVLDVSNPFVPAPGSSIENLTVTFSTDENNRVHYWLLNKNVSTAIDFTVNLSGTLSLRDILNNTDISAGKTYTVHLEPGEGKVYGISCPADYNLTESSPHTVNKVVLAENAITSTAQVNSGISVEYVAGKSIVFNPGFNSQTSSVFKGMIADCNHFPSPLKLSGGNNSIANYSTEQNENSTVTVYPNPTNGSFNININFEDPTLADLTISNSVGAEIYKESLGTVKNYTKEIDLEKEPNGFYYVKIIGSDRSIIRKIILSK